MNFREITSSLTGYAQRHRTITPQYRKMNWHAGTIENAAVRSKQRILSGFRRSSSGEVSKFFVAGWRDKTARDGGGVTTGRC